MVRSAGSGPPHEIDPGEPTLISRRKVIVGAAAGTGLAWAVPAVATIERAAAASAPACQAVHTTNFSQKIEQTMAGAAPGAGGWNNKYGWSANFRMDVSDAACTATATVRVKVQGVITDAEKAAWQTKVSGAWSRQFKLCCATPCCPNGYTISAALTFVNDGQDQVVTVAPTTTDMTHWRADGTDINHEFGHMLGNPDEYFTVNGTNFGAGRQANGNVMNNPANLPVGKHYLIVAAAANQALAPTKSACVVTAPDSAC